MAAFILLSFLIYAQQENVPDTLLVLPADTSKTIEPPVQEVIVEDDDDYVTEENEDKKEPEYFLKKSVIGNGLESFQKRKLPDSFVKTMQADKNFWYANKVFEKKKPKEVKQRFDFSIFNIILWMLIIGGFVAFLVIFLANSNVRLFRKSKVIGVEENEEETENIFAINYQKEIDKAVNAGNYRLATRLMFLRLLRGLSERNIIQYKQDRTNFDYLLQLHNTAWYAGFFKITRNYEYAWYGQFNVDQEKFTIIKNDFQNFEKLLNRS